MADLIYDTEKLNKAKKALDALRDDLDEDLGALDTALEDLKKGWNTEAGKTFFEDHQDTWSIYVRQYTKKLEGVSNMLLEAINEYDQVSQKVENLSI